MTDCETEVSGDDQLTRGNLWEKLLPKLIPMVKPHLYSYISRCQNSSLKGTGNHPGRGKTCLVTKHTQIAVDQL